MAELGYKVERFGQEQEPVVIIDDFYSDVDALRQDAASKTYQKIGPFYPGIRAQASPSYLGERMTLLTEALKDVFDFQTGAELTECAYSLVTTPRSELTPIQRLPHYDGTDAGRLAVLHYLSGSGTGGTSFYRHVATGFETITQDRFEFYKSTLAEEIVKFGLPPQDYVDEGKPQFTLIGRIASKPNRCILYRGITLHSGYIPEGLQLDNDPRKGRLTINTFLSAK